MERPGIAVRSIAKDGKNRFEITEAKTDPGRRADQLPGVAENEPAKIGCEIAPGEFLEMKTGQGLPTGDQ
jgi:hypothetical protein